MRKFIGGFCAYDIRNKTTCAGLHMSRDMGFPTMWYLRPAKAQTSLRIRAFASRLNIL